MDLAIALENNGFDIGIDGHDLATESGLRTAVILSLFTDRRAEGDDIIHDGTDDRRGCWQDMFDDHIKGSRLWLLSREKETDDVLVRAQEYAEEALQWLVDNAVAIVVTVTAEWERRGLLGLRIAITLPGDTQYNDVFNYPVGVA